MWMWKLKDLAIIGIIVLFSVFAFAYAGLWFPLVIAGAYAFLTIQVEDTSIMDFIRYATTSSQVSSVTGNSHKQFTIVFKANSGYTPVSGTVTVYYRDPQNMSNEIFGTLSFTQPAATPDYTISITPASISVDPYGGTQKLKVSYVYMQEAVNLTYLLSLIHI